MDKDKDEALSYFPNDDWYDFFTGTYQYKYSPTSSIGTYNLVKSPIDSGIINLHIKGGSIIPVQEVTENTLTTYDLKIIKTDLKITVSTIPSKNSLGKLYYDDGISLDSLKEKSKHALITLSYSPSSMVLAISQDGSYRTTDQEMLIGSLKFMHPGTLKDVKCGRMYDSAGKDTNVTFKASSTGDNLLTITVNADILKYGSMKLNDRC